MKNKRIFLASTFLLFLSRPLQAEYPALSQEVRSKSHLSKAIGTVQSLDPTARRISIKGKDKKIRDFILGENTKVLKGSNGADLSRVKPGDHVILRFENPGKTVVRIDLLSGK